MTALVHFEAARRALAEAALFDDVMKIKDVAEQAALYARQAKDTELIERATEIKVRSERKAGQMLRDAKQSGLLEGHGGDRKSTSRSIASNLNEIGVTKDESSRWQALASIPDATFDEVVEAAKKTKGQVTTAFMLREAKNLRSANATPAKKKPAPGAARMSKADKRRLEEIEEAQARGVSMLSTYARLALTALRSQKEFSADEVEVLRSLATAIEQVSDKVNHE